MNKEKRIDVKVDKGYANEGYVIEKPRTVILDDETIKITGRVKLERPVYDKSVYVVATLETAENEIIHSKTSEACFFASVGIFDMEFSKSDYRAYLSDIKEIHHIGIIVGKKRDTDVY